MSIDEEKNIEHWKMMYGPYFMPKAWITIRIFPNKVKKKLAELQTIHLRKKKLNTFLNIKGHENGELNFFLIIPFLRVLK